MSEFAEELTARVRRALAALDAARADGDDYLAQLHEADLSNLRRIAGENGVEVSGLPGWPGLAAPEAACGV